MAEFVKAASSSVNNVTKSNAVITKQTEDQIKAVDGSVGSSVKLRQNQRDTTQS